MGVAGMSLPIRRFQANRYREQKNRPGFGGLADATERGESSGAVLPEVAVLKEAAREAAN